MTYIRQVTDADANKISRYQDYGGCFPRASFKRLQQETYYDHLTTFIYKFRKGEANGYGIQGIVWGLFGINDRPPPMMVAAQEDLLGDKDKRELVKSVIDDTGFKESELDYLFKLSAEVAERQERDTEQKTPHIHWLPQKQDIFSSR